MPSCPEEKNEARRWYRRAQRLMQSGEYRQALEAWCRAIDADREYAAAYFFRGACQYMLGRYRSAAADMDAAALFGHRDAQLWSRYETGGRDDETEGDDGGTR